MARDNGKFFNAEDCRAVKANYFINLVRQEVGRITDRCYEEASYGADTYRVECDDDDPFTPFNKEVMTRLKALGFKIVVENAKTYYVISWEE